MNATMKYILIVILVIIVLIAGCVKSSNTTISEEKNPHIQIQWTENNIQKITISEDNVTCYTYRTGYAISCLRDEKVL